MGQNLYTNLEILVQKNFVATTILNKALLLVVIIIIIIIINDFRIF